MNLRKVFNTKLEISLTKRHYIFIGLGIFLLNFIVKTYRLGRHSLWYDEVFSVANAQQSLLDIYYMSSWDTNPPIYYYLLHFWIDLFGLETEATVRMLSVLFSCFAAVLLFYFARKHINLRTAILASIIFLFHGAVFRYAQETRCFSLIILCSIAAYHFLFNFLKTEKIQWFIYLGIVCAIMFYTHYVTIFFTLTLGLQYLILSPQRKKFLYFLIAASIIVLLLLPWTTTMLGLINNTQKGMTWIDTPGYNDLKSTVVFLFQHKLWLIVTITGLAACFLPISIYSKNTKRTIFHLAGWSFGALTICFLLSLLHPVFAERYFLFAVPGIILLISTVINSTNFRGVTWIGSISIASYFIVVFSPAAFSSNVSNTKNNLSLFFSKEDTLSNTLYLVGGQPEAIAYYLDKDIFKDYTHFKGRLLNKYHMQYISNAWEINKLDFSGFKTIKVHEEFYDLEDAVNIQNVLKEKFILKEELTVDNVKISTFENMGYDSSFSTTNIVENDNYQSTFWEDTSRLVRVAYSPGDGQCIRIAKDQGFSPKHYLSLAGYQQTPMSTIEVDCYVKQTSLSPVMQVISLKDKDGNEVYWGGFYTHHYVSVEDVWCHMHVEFPISMNLPKFETIETYFWADEYNGEALIDRFCFQVNGLVKK